MQVTHTQKYFEIQNWRKYHDFHVQSDALLLAGVFENFRNMCLKIYKIDPAKFKRAALKAALKVSNVKLDLLICY